jgi:hypothetical protein
LTLQAQIDPGLSQAMKVIPGYEKGKSPRMGLFLIEVYSPRADSKLSLKEATVRDTFNL